MTVDDRLAALEAEVRSLRALWLRPEDRATFAIVARVVGDGLFTSRQLFYDAAHDAELSAALAESTPKKLGWLLARAAEAGLVEACGDDAAGKIWRIRLSAPRN